MGKKKSTFMETVSSDTWWVFVISFAYIVAGFMGWISAFFESTSTFDSVAIFIGVTGLLMGIFMTFNNMKNS